MSTHDLLPNNVRCYVNVNVNVLAEMRPSIAAMKLISRMNNRSPCPVGLAEYYINLSDLT